jgi:hypothetical protein
VRCNLLIVDTQEILRAHPYPNREVEADLANFPIQSQEGQLTSKGQFVLSKSVGGLAMFLRV